MTIAEFKAWLEGFEAAMEGPPTADQWTKIKAKIGALKEAPSVQDVWPLKPRKEWFPTIRYEDDRTIPLRAH